MMKRILKILFLFISIAASCQAALPDSIANRCAMLAARGEVRQLRPLYRQHKAELPTYVRLFCDLSIARAEGDNHRTNQCVDSLVNNFPKQVGSVGRLALTELKAENLLNDGLYEELQAYADQQIRYLKRHNFRAARIDVFRDYAQKAVRYGSSGSNGRILGLAERRSDFELLKAYRSEPSLTAFARLTARAELARAFNRPDVACASADSLLRFYADSLNAEVQTTYATTCIENYISQGLWEKLADFCEFATILPQLRAVPLETFASIARELRNEQPFVLEQPSTPTSVPTTRDWPLLLPASINGGSNVYFHLNTGQHRTIITEADARQFGARVLNVTLSVNTMFGKVDVRPAFLRELRVGSVRFRNLLVYVFPAAAMTADIKPEICRILGNRELMRLGEICIYPEKIVFAPSRMDFRKSQPNLRLNDNYRLQLQAEYEGATCGLSLESGSPGNVLSAVVFPPEETDTLDFHLTLNGECALVPAVELSEVKDGNSCGILGLPFLRGFSLVRFDFGGMKLTIEGKQQYNQRYLADYTADGDLFGLERNAPALKVVADDSVTSDFLRFLVDKGKNVPNSVISLARRLEPALFGSRTEEELLMVETEKVRALGVIGHYAEASADCRKLLDNNAFSGSARLKIQRYEQLLRAAISFGAPQYLSTVDSLAVPFNQTDKTVSVQVGAKPYAACIDITQPITTISMKAVQKLGAHIFFHDAHDTYAILPELTIGTARFRNIFCKVVDGKDIKIVLGFNLFRLVPQLTLTQNQLILSKRQTRNGIPLRFDKYLCAQGETNAGYVTLRLKMNGQNSLLYLKDTEVSVAGAKIQASDAVPGDYNEQENPYQGEISIDYLINRQGHVTFDWEKMKME